MGGNGVASGSDVVENAFADIGLFDEVIAHRIDVVAMVHIGQLHDAPQALRPERFHNIRPAVLRLARDIIDQAANEEYIVRTAALTPFHLRPPRN